MIHLFFSLEAAELLSLSKCYLLLCGAVLFWGKPLPAAFLAGLSVFCLQDEKLSSASIKTSEQWLVVSAVSIMTSATSWFLLWHSSRLGQAESFKAWFFAMAVQKITGLAIGFFLYRDYMVGDLFSKGTSKRGGASDDLELLILHIKILEGRNLVAKDTNMFGRPTTSDPYVKVNFGEVRMGATNIIVKSLNPVWENQSFHLNILGETIQKHKKVECTIFDHDHMSRDDPMGTVHVPIPKGRNQRNMRSSRWHPVQNGRGDTFCRNATGDLLVEVEVKTVGRSYVGS